MGHDLITIYWLKAVEYLLALSYLPLFVLFWKLVNPKRRAEDVAPAAAPGWADQLRGAFELPAGLFFHPGHTWVRVEGDDTVLVGMDAFAQRLVGSGAQFTLPAVGEAVTQGAPALALSAHGRSADLLAPVDGTVVAVNPLAAGAPRSVHAAPYTDGWLLKVVSPRLAANLKNLLSGDVARRWMDTATERVGREMGGVELGQVYADGGSVVDGIATSAAPERWDAVARSYFLTAQGGPNA